MTMSLPTMTLYEWRRAGFIYMTRFDFRMPPGDLCNQLRVSKHDSIESDSRTCTASNFQLRVFVGTWMLQRDVETYCEAARRLISMYERNAPGLLDRPGYLTDAIIAREVMALVDKERESE